MVTTPIFTRIMETDQYGVVSTYNAWSLIIEVLAVIGLTSSGVINVGLNDYSEKRNEYLANVTIISNFFTVIIFGLLFVVKASCIGQILPAENFYTFDAKYNNAESKLTIPADLEEELTNKVRSEAVKAFKAIDGKGFARVDFFVNDKTKKIYINEINTIPGFTQISMYPKLWEQSGISYSEVLDKLIELALEK